MAKKQSSKQSVSKNDSTLKVTPLADRVLVRPFSEEELSSKNQYGIIIPETIDKEKPEQGKVIAVGEGRYEDGRLIPMKLKVGDKILFSKYGYDEVKIGEEEYYILKEESVLAIIK